MLLRRRAQALARPYRIWLYPVPCFVALVGWLFDAWDGGLEGDPVRPWDFVAGSNHFPDLVQVDPPLAVCHAACWRRLCCNLKPPI